MKKILLSAHCKTQEQKNSTKALLEILLSKGYCVDIITNFVLDVQKNNVQLASTDSLKIKEYDVIFAHNLKGYERIKQLAKTKHIPVIYMINQQDCIREYLYDVSLVSKFLIINHNDELVQQLFPNSCNIHIPYPYLPPQQNTVTTEPNTNILVATDDKILLKTISVFNNYGKYHFTIVTGIPSVIKKVVNANCTIVSAKKANISALIKDANLVVGCGQAVLTGIGYGKPAIVVGKYGFGRKVTTENIERHLLSLFRGRLGSQGEEYIPFHLLSYEIDSCMNAKPEELEANGQLLANYLTTKYEQTALLIDSLVRSVTTSRSILDTPLMLSPLYRFVAYDASSYIVVDDRVMKIHAMVEQDEYDLIYSFEEGTTAKTVMQNSLYGKTAKQFTSFIEYLVAYKFLIPYDECTDF